MTKDPARTRFFVIGLIRLSGVALAFLGITILSKRLIEPAEIVGGIFIAIGAIDVLLLPLFLARRWRTPPGS